MDRRRQVSRLDVGEGREDRTPRERLHLSGDAVVPGLGDRLEGVEQFQPLVVHLVHLTLNPLPTPGSSNSIGAYHRPATTSG